MVGDRAKRSFQCWVSAAEVEQAPRGEWLGLDVDPASSADDPPAAGSRAMGQGERADLRWLDRCFGELSVGESVPLLAVAAVEGDSLAVDSHRFGAPYAVRPHPHGLVGA